MTQVQFSSGQVGHGGEFIYTLSVFSLWCVESNLLQGVEIWYNCNKSHLEFTVNDIFFVSSVFLNNSVMKIFGKLSGHSILCEQQRRLENVSGCSLPFPV